MTTTKRDRVGFNPNIATSPGSIGEVNYNSTNNRFEKALNDGAGNAQVEQFACLSDIPDLTSIQADITQLQADVTSNDADITQLQADVADNDTDIAAIQAQLALLPETQCGEEDMALFSADANGFLCASVTYPAAFTGAAIPKVVVSAEGQKDCFIEAQVVKGSRTLTGFTISLSTSDPAALPAAGQACVVWHAVQPA